MQFLIEAFSEGKLLLNNASSLRRDDPTPSNKLAWESDDRNDMCTLEVRARQKFQRSARRISTIPKQCGVTRKDTSRFSLFSIVLLNMDREYQRG